LDDIATAANNVLERNGFPRHPTEEYKNLVGEGARRLIVKALPDRFRNEDIIDKCLQDYLKEYGHTWTLTTRLYDGIDEMLNGLVLRKMKLSILSNKTDEFTQKCVERFLSRWKFDAVVGESRQIPPKPDSKGILLVSELLTVEKDRIIYLGDSGVDMKTAKAVGIFAVGASWGFRPREELEREGADRVIGYPEELLKLFDK
ncbi:MAG TPA: HAD family hydrolase, partial [Syntrophorhabdaceae bacterium]|nr:HAD family hydrolase [Syntrophorhabdaceae bacterium]